LVDRLWPRGTRKERAALDAWAKGVAPSDALRREYHAGLEGDSFEAAYRTELDGADPSLFDGSGVVLLTAAKASPNHADVLRAVWKERQKERLPG
jgi:uncharacterized protein YeaO (DUF488 family)